MTSARLNEATLPHARASVARPHYTRAACRIGWLHFGPGAFHRAHQAYYADRLLERDPRWAISAVSLHSGAVRDALAPQNNLYCLAELAAATPLRVIGALREILVAPSERPAVFARLEAPETHLVTLTVTEKGYCLGGDGQLDFAHPDIAHDLRADGAVRSVIGFLAEGLRRRHARGVAPFAVVSCDNLPDNGPTLHAAVRAFAAQRDPALAGWIEQEVSFPRTMVDSITPATDADLIARVAAESGLDDAWPVQRERFTQWVIEDVPAVRVADWSAVGVTLTRDVSVYDRAKLRVVNGAHSTLAYLGLLRGHATVAEAMRDLPLARCVERLLREEVAPGLRASGSFEVGAYIEATLERFRNPSVRHQLAQIAWDGSKKLPVRLLPSVVDALSAGRSFVCLALALAAWMRFVVWRARTDGELTDPHAEALLAVGSSCTDEPQQDVARFLALGEIFPPAIATAAVFRTAVVAAYLVLGLNGALPEAVCA
ncbi:MAG: mannitol dehydrogenase family protein [Steroidobacteraceae bacterium]